MNITSPHDDGFDRQRVGLVIPTYNRLGYLKQAIESVLCQTYRNFELVIVDDKSTDGTSDYIATVADSRVRHHINRSNLGLAETINVGISLLSQDIQWCSILCDDDYLDANYLAESIHAAERSRAKAIVHSSIVFVDQNGELIRNAKPAPAEESASAYIKARAEFERERYLTGILFARGLFEQIGGYPKFRTGMAADDALVIAMSLRDRLVYSDRGLVYIRIHDRAESQALESLHKHLLSLLDYREFCAGLAAVNSVDTNECRLLLKRATLHAYVMSSRIWLESLRKLIKKGMAHTSAEANELFALGLDRELLLPMRVRISAFLSTYLRICPEAIGLYRSAWRQLDKVSKRIRLVSW